MQAMKQSSREKTAKESDEWFLNRLSNLGVLTGGELAVAARLVKRYHASCFTDINYLIALRNTSLTNETLLNNHEYLLGRTKKPTPSYMDAAAAIYGVEEMRCSLRDAKPSLRREAVALTRLTAAINDMDDAPSQCWDDVREEHSLSPDYRDLAVDFSGRVDELISIIEADPELHVGAIRGILNRISSPLIDGAL